MYFDFFLNTKKPQNALNWNSNNKVFCSLEFADLSEGLEDAGNTFGNGETARHE